MAAQGSLAFFWHRGIYLTVPTVRCDVSVHPQCLRADDLTPIVCYVAFLSNSRNRLQ